MHAWYLQMVFNGHANHPESNQTEPRPNRTETDELKIVEASATKKSDQKFIEWNGD